MSAIRLARGATRRSLIVKFAGCYHGHVASLLVKAGSGAVTHGHPDSAGIPAAFAGETRVLEYNEPEALEARLSEQSQAVLKQQQERDALDQELQQLREELAQVLA